MDNILNILTDEEKTFINHHGIEPTDIYDARGENSTQFYKNAKCNDCHYVINSCFCGFRLKDRHNHCLKCNPASVAFVKREIDKGVVYVAFSGKYTKVGMVENNINSVATALNKREYRLNSEGGYGGREGWQTIKSWKLEKDAGKVEREAQALLKKYNVKEDYTYSGNKRNAKEIFECPVQTAIDAVKKAIEMNK